MSGEFQVRAAVPDDLRFVESTLIRGTPKPDWFPGSMSEWQSTLRGMPRRMLDMGGARLWVLCSPDMPSAIMAWSIELDGHVLHAYFRPELRFGRTTRFWRRRLVGLENEGA